MFYSQKAFITLGPCAVTYQALINLTALGFMHSTEQLHNLSNGPREKAVMFNRVVK